MGKSRGQCAWGVALPSFLPGFCPLPLRGFFPGENTLKGAGGSGSQSMGSHWLGPGSPEVCEAFV